MMTARSTSIALQKLRDIIKNTSYVPQCLQGYIIPTNDCHQSEYIAAADKRREFICGFTGSSGTAIITEKHAALWTDGRYFMQAQQELDANWTLMKDGLPDTPSDSKWLCDVLPVSSKIGVDPFLIDYNTWKTMSSALKTEGHSLVPVAPNLIDFIWDDRPNPTFNSIEFLPIEYTGKTWLEKVTSLHEEMSKNKASVLIVTALDEVAWLFNLRGSDIEYNPVFFSYAILTLKSVHILIDQNKLTTAARKNLQVSEDSSLKLSIHPYENIVEVIKMILADESEGKFWITPHSSYALVSLIPEERRLLKASPVAVKKALKNETEIAGARHAHIKDAVALCEFFAWLTNEVSEGNITEISAAEKLENFRKLQDDFVGPSFVTISASGPNGSIIHYHPCLESNRKVTTLELYLCDSGAQYKDGTTDVTRTLHFGTPTSFEKECYTLVLKGQIALSSAIFPKLVKGMLLDSFARKFLWDSGLDYMHGTSHGVGAFLSVHEGPMGINFRPHPDDPGLQPGMIMSIEPGYYEDGEFGIRLENLAVIKKIQTSHNFKNRDYLTFESLTLIPYQTKLIEPSMLTTEEIKWLNDYHVTCREVVGKALEQQGKTEALHWLLKETLPLG